MSLARETGAVVPEEDLALVDLVDRLIDGGVVVGGDVVLALAGVDLVHLGVRLVLEPAYDGGAAAARSRRPGGVS